MKCSQEPPSTAHSWCDWSKSYAMVSCWGSSINQPTVISKTPIMVAYVRLINSSRRKLFTGSRTIWKMFLSTKSNLTWTSNNRQDSLKETAEETTATIIILRRRSFSRGRVSVHSLWVIIWWCGSVKTSVLSYFIKNFIRSFFIKRTNE